MDPEAKIEAIVVLANAFNYLAECFFPPDPSLAGTLEKLSAELSGPFPQPAAFAGKMREAWSGGALDSLNVDHAALFVGPYQVIAPPYGSVYLEGVRRVMGESTAEVCRYYHEAGLDLAEGFDEPPDHVAAELEFLSYLLFRQAEAIHDAEIEAAADYARKARRFFEEHPDRWLRPFADRIGKGAESQFYKELAGCTQALFQEYEQHSAGDNS